MDASNSQNGGIDGASGNKSRERSGLLSSPLGLFALGVTAVNLFVLGCSYYSHAFDPERAHTILHLAFLGPTVFVVTVVSGFVMGLGYFAPSITPGAAGRVFALGFGNLVFSLLQIPLFIVLR